jgi:predicted ATP-dependent endonuclease of OLD family
LKITSIRISNILSFEYKDTLDECDEIKFSEGLDILIGPNGAGKTNFLQIINEIFKQIFFHPHIFDHEQIRLNKMDSERYPISNPIQVVNIPRIILAKNRSSNKNISKIRIIIKLNKDDIRNLNFIKQEVDELERINSQYSHGKPPLFDHARKVNELKEDSIFTFEFTSQDNNPLSISSSLNIDEQFIFHYLLNFEYLQCIIEAGNKWNDKRWMPLKNTMAVISGYRNYQQITSDYKITEPQNVELRNFKQNKINLSLKQMDTGEPIVFHYVRIILAYEYQRILREIGDDPKNKRPVREMISEIPIVKNINDSLIETLQLQFKISPNDMNLGYEFNFYDKNNVLIQNSNLSAGEKGIIHFIFTIYGYDLENGLLIIDEPELHIHPQMQKKLLKILQNAQDKLKMQIITATHSPAFVNSDTIDGVRRFYRDKSGFTKTKVSDKSPETHNLIRYLDYTNATNILFVDEVIVVEGDSDQYFYEYFLRKFKEKKELNEKIKINFDIDFVHGAGVNDKDFLKFFKDWNIITYFIRDKDKFQGTEKEYENKYENNIFILKYGKDLEDYLGLSSSSKLKNVIDFCNTKYDTWINHSDNQNKINDLENIFSKIYTKHIALK